MKRPMGVDVDDVFCNWRSSLGIPFFSIFREPGFFLGSIVVGGLDFIDVPLE